MSFLVILGMHRSGTSALAGVMHALGFSPGKHLIAADKFNERGYFEDAGLNYYFENLLLSLGRSWLDERQMPRDWLDSAPAQAALQELAVEFGKAFDLDRPCVLKDPRVCRLLPLAKVVLTNLGITPSFVFSLRSPYAVIASIAQRDGIPAQRAALLYVAYLLEAERHTRGLPRIFVEYEKLLTDWQDVIGQIESGLGIRVQPLDESSSAIESIDAFLSPALNHGDIAAEGPASGIPMELAVALHENLRQPQSHQTHARLDELHDKWVEYLDSVSPWLEDAASLGWFKSQLPRWLLAPSEKIINDVSPDPSSQLFYPDSRGQYDETRSIRIPWRYGQTVIQRFVLPPLVDWAGPFRWDIIDRPGFCSVARFWVENSFGEQVWTWQPGMPLFRHTSADLHVLGTTPAGKLELLATGFDPHGTPGIPDTMLTQMCEGWRVAAEWTAVLPTTGMPAIMNWFKSAIVEQTKSKAALQQTSKDLAEMQQRSASQTKELLMLQHQGEQVRTELIRAETQLGLLKELMLGAAALESL